MARGTFQIINVIPNGGSPNQYILTIADLTGPGPGVGDHVGTRTNSVEPKPGAIYLVLNVPNLNTVVIEDSLTEAEGVEFGQPIGGDGGYGTPEPNNDLTQLPFNTPGWDAMHRRNMFLLDTLDISTGLLQEIIDAVLENLGLGAAIGDVLVRAPDGSGEIWAPTNVLGRSFSFVASDWSSGTVNEIDIIRLGAPAAGQIGPHKYDSSGPYQVLVFKETGSVVTQVDCEVETNVVTGNITIRKAGLAPDFDGRAVISSIV
jgi:hypothetical protein